MTQEPELEAARLDRAYATGMRMALVMAAQGAEDKARRIADRLNSEVLRVLRLDSKRLTAMKPTEQPMTDDLDTLARALAGVDAPTWGALDEQERTYWRLEAMKMAGWQLIETAPEGTEILTWSSYNEEEPYAVDRFRWVTEVFVEVESESRNAKGRRRIIQEHSERKREWERNWGAEYWMPLPEPPTNPSASSTSGPSPQKQGT